MYQNERELEIRKILSGEGYATVRQLSQWLYTSESTIRRALCSLEKQGIVKRSYGGAELLKSSMYAPTFDARVHHNIPAKERMAQKAAGLVKKGDIVFLDQSSSSLFVAKALMQRSDLTVATNNTEIISLLGQSELEVICCGGRLCSRNRICLLGDDAHAVFRQMRADVAFFSSNSLAAEGVIYDCYREEVCIRSTMLEHAAKKYFLCASEKYGHNAGYRQCSLDEIDGMITEIDDHDQFPTLRTWWEKIL